MIWILKVRMVKILIIAMRFQHLVRFMAIKNFIKYCAIPSVSINAFEVYSIFADIWKGISFSVFEENLTGKRYAMVHRLDKNNKECI